MFYLGVVRNVCWWLTSIGLVCSLFTMIALIVSPTLFASGPGVLLKPMGLVLIGYIGLELCSILRALGYGYVSEDRPAVLTRTF